MAWIVDTRDDPYGSFYPLWGERHERFAMELQRLGVPIEAVSQGSVHRGHRWVHVTLPDPAEDVFAVYVSDEDLRYFHGWTTDLADAAAVGAAWLSDQVPDFSAMAERFPSLVPNPLAQALERGDAITCTSYWVGNETEWRASCTNVETGEVLVVDSTPEVFQLIRAAPDGRLQHDLQERPRFGRAIPRLRRKRTRS